MVSKRGEVRGTVLEDRSAGARRGGGGLAGARGQGAGATRRGRGCDSQSRSERYSTNTSGGAAPTRCVLVLCHSGGPGRFRESFVPTKQWL